MVLKRVAENGKEVEVQNRDILVLQRIFYAMQDVCAMEERCQWVEDRLYKITQTLSSQPGGGERKTFADNLASMEKSESAYKASLRRYQKELEEAEAILAGISNPNMRTFVTLVYVLMLSGEEVRKRLNMTEYAFKRARKAIESADNMASVVWVDKYVLAENK